MTGFVTMPSPIEMLLWCPQCHERHIDLGEFATKTHHTHACQRCGMVWRPAIVATVGVEFLPGFRNPETKPEPYKLHAATRSLRNILEAVEAEITENGATGFRVGIQMQAEKALDLIDKNIDY